MIFGIKKCQEVFLTFNAEQSLKIILWVYIIEESVLDGLGYLKLD